MTVSTISVSSVSVGIVAEAVFFFDLSVTIVVSVSIGFNVLVWYSDIIMVIVMVVIEVFEVTLVVMVVFSVFIESISIAGVSITIGAIGVLLSGDPGKILPKLILCGDKSNFEDFASFFISLFLCFLFFIKSCLKFFTRSNDVLNGRLGVSGESFLKVCVVSSKSSLLRCKCCFSRFHGCLSSSIVISKNLISKNADLGL